MRPRIVIASFFVVALLVAELSILVRRHLQPGRPPAPPTASPRLLVSTPASTAPAQSTVGDPRRRSLDDALRAKDIRALRRLAREWAGADRGFLLRLLAELADQLRETGRIEPAASFFLRTALRDLTRGDPAGTAAWIVDHLPVSGERAFAFCLVAAAWVARDAYAARAWATALPADAGREAALRAVFAALSAIDPAAAARRLDTVRDFQSRDLAIATIAWYWARKDARAALAWAWPLAKGPGRTDALANIALALMARDRDAARKLVEDLPAGSTREQAARTMAAEWARENPAAANAWLAERFPAKRRLAPAAQIALLSLSRQDPQSAAAWAAIAPDDRVRRQLQSVLTTPVPGDEDKSGSGSSSSGTGGSGSGSGGTGDSTDGTSEDAASFPDSFYADHSLALMLAELLSDGDARSGIIYNLAVQWAREDPAAAATWVVEQLPVGRSRDNALQAVLWSWAASDRDAATTWAGAQADAELRAAALASVAMAIASTDPATAAQVVTGLPAGNSKDDAIDNIAFKYARQDSDAASAWALALAAGSDQDHAVYQVASCLAQSDMARAQAWAAGLPSGSQRSSAQGGIASVQARTDLDQARTMAEALPEGVGREKSLAAIATRMAASDPTATAQWLSGLPAGASRDSAIYAYVLERVAADPQGALTWAGRIEEASLRSEAQARCQGR